MSEILSLVTMFVPLFLIVWIANVAEGRRQREQPYEGLALVAYIFLFVLYGLGVLAGLLMQFGSWIATLDPSLFESLGQEMPLASLPLLALGLWLPSLLGIILLLPPVRRLFARFTALNAESPVHAVALSLSMLVLVNLIMTLGIGLGNLADILASAEEEAESNTLLSLWVQQILTALLAMVGVGWLSRRSWGETLARLGIAMPSDREWLIGIGVGLGMVPVVLLIEALSSFLGMGANADVERLSEQLLGALFTTPFGILTIGLSAGLGEETLFRGALLPRFGLILSSLLFALVHSNYGITLSTLVVLILGLVLGWLRLRYNTSTAMITHAVYNMTLGLLAYLSTFNIDV
ncbi:MAG: CPBP family intramembrane metalloprotease [Caldilineaceae bacterium]|nr:CPBP family intramembrane metalloprotease [Caldilineaceae bacterium]